MSGAALRAGVGLVGGAKNSVIVGRVAARVHRNFNLVSKFAYDGGVLESN